MKLKLRIAKNTYLANCTITQLINRTRKNKYEEDYDLVEVECETWRKIRNIYFDGRVAIPAELEGDEIVTWDVVKIDNSKNDISMDIYEIRNAFNSIRSKISTHEIKELFKDLQKFFEEEVELLTSKPNNKKERLRKMDLYEYIKLYDKAFNTHIYDDVTEKEFPMIEKIFYDLGEEIYIPSDKHKKLAEKRGIISDKILKQYTPEQEQLFSDYLEIQSEMDTDINRQILIIGFCICYQQLKEMNALK